MEKLSELTIREFLEKITSSSPAPGGGSLAALACACGAALVEMAAAVTAEKEGEAPELRPLREEAGRLRETSLSLMDEDAEAYLRVVEAFKLPKGTEEEKDRRREAVQAALRTATLVPLRTEAAALAVLRLVQQMAPRIKSAVFCDLGVGTLLASAGLRGGLYNVAINLKGSKNTKLIEEASGSQEKILGDSRGILDELEPLIREKLGLDLWESRVQLG